MNTYSVRFKATCPNNGLIIAYKLTIKTREKIMVETIIAACHMHSSGYHEDIAAAIYARIGAGVHTLRANHHGVRINTVLGK